MQKTRLGWTRRRLLRTFSSNGKKHGQTDVCSSRSAIIGMAPGRATSGCLQAPLKLIGYSCQLSRTSLHFLRCNKVSLLEYSGRRVPPPGELLGRRSCNSQYSSPMICLWRIGMQGCMAYQPFGLRLLCWVLTICAKLLAMIFIS